MEAWIEILNEKSFTIPFENLPQTQSLGGSHSSCEAVLSQLNFLDLPISRHGAASRLPFDLIVVEL